MTSTDSQSYPSINPKPYTIDPNKPFDGDILNSKLLIQHICTLIDNPESLVVGLTAPWGYGKSTTIDRLYAYINNCSDDCLDKQCKLSCVKYNAFFHDHHDDVFISMAQEIKKCIVQHKKTIDNIKGGVKDFALDTKNFIKSIPHGISCNLTIDAFASMNVSLSDMINAFNAYSESTTQDYIDKHNSKNDLLHSFKENLQYITDTLGIRLVFIIDELDRCKPTFSIEILEKIKHVFNVKNILFVLVYNEDQIHESIQHAYGIKNPQTYLQKFINLTYPFPSYYDPSLEKTSIINSIVKRYRFDDSWNGWHVATCYMIDIMVYRDEDTRISNIIDTSILFTPRTIERICQRIATYCVTYKQYALVLSKEYSGYPTLSNIVFLCILFVCQPALFNQLEESANLAEKQANNSIIPTDSIKRILQSFYNKTGMARLLSQYIVYHLRPCNIIKTTIEEKHLEFGGTKTSLKEDIASVKNLSPQFNRGVFHLSS